MGEGRRFRIRVEAFPPGNGRSVFSSVTFLAVSSCRMAITEQQATHIHIYILYRPGHVAIGLKIHVYLELSLLLLIKN